MKVHLPFGEHGIEATLPDGATVLRPAATPPLANPDAAVRHAIAAPLAGPPLAALARPGATATIVVSDITRPVPNAVLLPPMLEALEAGGVAPDAITILIGTGLHRVSRDDERERIVGADIASRYRVLDHDARDAASHRYLLTTPRGTPVEVNAAYLEADIRILTGFVEPHLFAGYSGGGKAMLPGICGAAAIMANHDATMIGHPNATWCTTQGNPIFEEMRDVALKTAPSFTLNVTLDERKRITGVFSGELIAAHDAAIAQAERQAICEIPGLFDVVVVTNMGYPADLVLYQAVKGMSVAAQAVRFGGAILLVAECREGLGAPEYAAMLRSELSPGALLDRLVSAPHTAVDQWQVQVQAMVQARADVWVHSMLDRAAIESAHLRFAATVEGALEEIAAEQRAATGREPSICILPYGQLTVPRVRADA